MSAGLRVVGVDGLPVSVTIQNAAGTTLSAWADAALTSAVTMPLVITSDTTFWLAGQSSVLVSMKIGGVELGPVPVSVSAGGASFVTSVPLPSDDDSLKHIAAAGAITTELGYAERTTNDTTTNTVYASATSNKINSLIVAVTGQGVPVSVEVYCPTAYHSVADKNAALVLLINGSVTSGQTSESTSSIAAGANGLLLLRSLVLASGVEYIFEVGKYLSAAGTGTYVAWSDAPMHLKVSR